MSEPIIYGISGLGADARVFSHLQLSFPIKPMHWIEPHQKENLETYATRFLNEIDTSKPFILLGVSFGGLVAVEIAKKLKPLHTFLISSCESSSAFPYHIRWLKMLFAKLHLPLWFYKPNKHVMTFLFKAKNKKLLHDILSDTDPAFAKWAVHALLSWSNKTAPKSYTKLHGDRDLLFPAKPNAHMLILKEAGHFMIVDQADEISSIQNKKIQSFDL